MSDKKTDLTSILEKVDIQIVKASIGIGTCPNEGRNLGFVLAHELNRKGKFKEGRDPVAYFMRHFRIALRRLIYGSCFTVSLDEKFGDDEASLIDTISAPEYEEVAAWRVGALGNEIELMLDVLRDKTADSARKLGFTDRALRKRLSIIDMSQQSLLDDEKEVVVWSVCRPKQSQGGRRAAGVERLSKVDSGQRGLFGGNE